MRMVFGLVLVFGVALAGFAVYMVQGYINQTEVQLEAERAERLRAGTLVEVFVVNKPLKYGDALTREDVQVMLWPEATLPEAIFRDEAILFPVGAENRYVLRPMEMFEPVLGIKVTEPGEDAGLTSRLAKGMRAFAIKVDVASGVSGFVQPNDSVDIYWTGASASSESQGEITQLIESAIKVIAVDQVANEDRSSGALIARTVTVEATPEQVARLAQAQATGRLALSLVGSGDTDAIAEVEIDQRDLLGVVTREVTPEEVERVCTVRARKGAEIVTQEIPCN